MTGRGRMGSFWGFARRMGRYRAMLVAAVLMALFSAGSLGVGLVGVMPVLARLLGEADPVTGEPPPDLPDMLRSWDQGPLRGLVPDSWIGALPEGTFSAVFAIVVGLGVLTIAGGAANFMHAFLSLTVVQLTVTAVRREAFHRVIRMPLKAVVASGTADPISRILSDTSALESGLTALLSKALSQLAKGVAAFAAALVCEARVTLVALLVAPALYTIIRRLGKRIRRASRSALASHAGLFAAATESLQGLRVVKVHTTERYEAGRFHRLNKDVMRQMMRVRTARALASPLVEALSILALGTLFLVAAKQIISNTVAADRFLAAISALFAAGASLKPLTGLVNDIQVSAGAADRLAELLARPQEPGHDHRLPRLPRHRESIELRSVSVTYPGADRPALRRVSLTVRAGERVAVVGANGSGKTTLLALVPRLFDPDPPGPDGVAGVVLIDGRDIREVSVRSLRRQIGVVTQETVLFRGTVRSNIAYGAEGVTDEAVRSAARRARADGFIAAMPQGYDTPVGEQGLTLSGGQRQRIAIARAILRDPAILILDEATSMIDADSEARIAEAVADFTRGRTCLIVAHRLSTVANADRIVVMDAGRVVDEGRHADLLARCEAYRLIARNQLLGGGSGPASSPA